MRIVERRIRALERLTSLRRVRDPQQESLCRALQRLSTEDLEVLEVVTADQESGIERTWTERELQVAQVYQAAMELERQTAEAPLERAQAESTTGRRG